MLLKQEHKIYNSDFEAKEEFQRFLVQKLEKVEEIYNYIKTRKEEMEEAAKGHRLANYVEEEYEELFVKLQNLKEELEEAQVSLRG